jgi:hypothetical protein
MRPRFGWIGIVRMGWPHPIAYDPMALRSGAFTGVDVLDLFLREHICRATLIWGMFVFDVLDDWVIAARMSAVLTLFMFVLIALPVNGQTQSVPTKPGTTTTTHRAIPDDNLAYPVLITGNNIAGSGFYLNTDKGTFLVSAKHVIFDPATGKLRSPIIEVRSYSKDPSDSNPNIFELNLSVLEVKGHQTQDVAVVKIADFGESPTAGVPIRANLLPGVLAKAINPNGIPGVSRDIVKPFDQVLVGNDVIVFGYPTSLDLKDLAQLDPMRPLLRRGLVAGENLNRRSLVIDCPVYPGNSGSLVLEIDPEVIGYHLFVIGVVSQFVPFADTAKYFTMLSNSGYSIATPMDFVLELTK